MKRLSLILAVSAFAGMAGIAMAQTELEGKPRRALGIERHAIDRTEESRTRADRQDSEPTVTKGWLTEPPGVGSQVASVSSANSTPPQAQCAADYASAVNWCFRSWNICLGQNWGPARFLRCSATCVFCLKVAEDAHEACLAEAEG